MTDKKTISFPTLIHGGVKAVLLLTIPPKIRADDS
jgi:hypothetical protein